MILQKPSEDPLVKNILEAFRQVSREVIKIARQTNTPVIVWDKGKTVLLSADEAEKSLK